MLCITFGQKIHNHRSRASEPISARITTKDTERWRKLGDTAISREIFASQVNLAGAFA